MQMSGTVFEGKTMDEAVKKGLDHLKITRDAAMITVIEEGKGGFLGIGARPFRVSVIKRPGGVIREPQEREDRGARGGRGGRDERGGRGGRGGRDERGGRGGRDERGSRDEKDKEKDKDKKEARGGREERGGRDERGGREERGGRGERKEGRGGRGERGPREERRPQETAAPAPAPVVASAPAPVSVPAPVAPPEVTAEGGDEPRKRRRRGRRGGRGRRRAGAPGEASTGNPAPLEGDDDMDMMDDDDATDMVAAAAPAPAPVAPAAPTPAPVVAAEPAAPAPVMAEETVTDAVADEPAAEWSSEDRGDRRERRGRRERREREPRSGGESATPAMSSDELAAASRAITEELLRKMGFEAKVTARAEGHRVEVTVDAERDDDLLIGRGGETRLALQHLLNRFLNRGDGSRYHLQLEVNDSWQQREDELAAMARQLADRAVAERVEVVTDLMNSQERRIVHVTLREDARVRTFSLGDGAQKRVAVAPADFPERTEDGSAS